MRDLSTLKKITTIQLHHLFRVTDNLSLGSSDSEDDIARSFVYVPGRKR